MFTLDYLLQSSSVLPEEKGLGSRGCCKRCLPRSSSGREESRTIGSGVPSQLLTGTPRCQGDTPFFPNQGKEGGVRGLPPLRARNNASLITGASVYLTKVCCIRIAQLRSDNKTATSILSLFDVRFGAEAPPINRGTLLPWGPYSG